MSKLRKLILELSKYTIETFDNNFIILTTKLYTNIVMKNHWKP